MADKSAKQTEVPAEEVDKSKAEEVVEDETKSEHGDNAENGEAAEKENGKEEIEDEAEEKNGSEDTEKVCSIKRKSVGGDVTDGKPAAEGATPEKKAKLDDTAEAANGEAAKVDA